MSVRFGLLALLERRSMHGYEMRRELARELGSEWAVNYGQVYTTLERLVRDGLVVQSETVACEDAPDRKLYTVTPAGRARLREWFLSPVGGTDAGRDELLAKVVLALTGDVPVADVIQAERKGRLRRIGELTELKESVDPVLDVAVVLEIDMSIARTEAVIRWLDTAEARIAKAAAAAPGAIGGPARVAGSGREAAPGPGMKTGGRGSR